MADERPTPKQMPLWALVALVVLFWVAGVTFGLEVGRDMAVSRPEAAAGIDRYTKPVMGGTLLAAFGLCIWLSKPGDGTPSGAK